MTKQTSKTKRKISEKVRKIVEQLLPYHEQTEIGKKRYNEAERLLGQLNTSELYLEAFRVLNDYVRDDFWGSARRGETDIIEKAVKYQRLHVSLITRTPRVLTRYADLETQRGITSNILNCYDEILRIRMAERASQYKEHGK
jgi:hypothetical protein